MARAPPSSRTGCATRGDEPGDRVLRRGPRDAEPGPRAGERFAASVASNDPEPLPWCESAQAPFASPTGARGAELGCGHRESLEVMRRRGLDRRGCVALARGHAPPRRRLAPGTLCTIDRGRGLGELVLGAAVREG